VLNAGDSRFVSNITSVYRVTAGSSFSSACPPAGRHQEELHVLNFPAHRMARWKRGAHGASKHHRCRASAAAEVVNEQAPCAGAVR
jgi:hypothetical protein